MKRSKYEDAPSAVEPMSYDPAQRETDMIALAVSLAEQQLRDGTASSQIITHYLKLATEKERLERVKLEQEVELMKAKTQSIKDTETSKELFAEAIKAFAGYTGQYSDDQEYEFHDGEEYYG